MLPWDTAATSLVPSVEDATAIQFRVAVCCGCVHVTPESIEVYMYPGFVTATNFVPSADDATDCQFWEVARCVHVTPAIGTQVPVPSLNRSIGQLEFTTHDPVPSLW